MKFLKDLLISATNGLFGRLLLVLIGAGGALTVSKVVTSDNPAAIGAVLATFNFAVVCTLIGFFRNLNIFKEWTQEQRQDEIRKLELEKEILELEIQRGNQQPTSNNENENESA